MSENANQRPGVCIHGGLRRKCETCDLADRLEMLERDIESAEIRGAKWALAEKYPIAERSIDNFGRVEEIQKEAAAIVAQYKGKGD